MNSKDDAVFWEIEHEGGLVTQVHVDSYGMQVAKEFEYNSGGDWTTERPKRGPYIQRCKWVRCGGMPLNNSGVLSAAGNSRRAR